MNTQVSSMNGQSLKGGDMEIFNAFCTNVSLAYIGDTKT